MPCFWGEFQAVVEITMSIWDQRSIFRQLVFFGEIALLRCRASGVDHHLGSYFLPYLWRLFVRRNTAWHAEEKKPCPQKTSLIWRRHFQPLWRKRSFNSFSPGKPTEENDLFRFPGFSTSYKQISCQKNLLLLSVSRSGIFSWSCDTVRAFEWDQKDCNFKLFMKFCFMFIGYC